MKINILLLFLAFIGAAMVYRVDERANAENLALLTNIVLAAYVAGAISWACVSFKNKRSWTFVGTILPLVCLLFFLWAFFKNSPDPKSSSISQEGTIGLPASPEMSRAERENDQSALNP